MNRSERRRPILQVLVAITLFILPSPNAWACSCGPMPPPCEAFAHATIIFLGTITEVLEANETYITRVRMTVDKAYKGVSEKTLVVYDDGMCDGPILKMGQQYLLYTRTGRNGEVPSRGCSRSRHVRGAAEDLKYLESLAGLSPTSAILGQVLTRTDDYYGPDKVSADAVVGLTGPSGTVRMHVNVDGRYSFDNLDPGKYGVTVEQSGYRLLKVMDPVSVEVEPKGCAVKNLILRRSWQGSISGRLERSNDIAAPAGIGVVLFRFDDREGKPEHLWLNQTFTNQQGEYAFDEVAPGKYTLAMNLYAFPTIKSPYPTLYWPAATTEDAASIIEISDQKTEERFDFNLPPELKAELVDGVVLFADGKPAARANVLIEGLLGNITSVDNENRPVADELGRFSFSAFQGFEYRLSASASLGRTRVLHSAHVIVSLSKGSPFVTLVVDRPGRFEGDLMARPKVPKR